MFEQEKYITCPKCMKRLRVKNSQQVEQKIITCPNCSSKLRVHFDQISEEMEAPQQAEQPIYDVQTPHGGRHSNDRDRMGQGHMAVAAGQRAPANTIYNYNPAQAPSPQATGAKTQTYMNGQMQPGWLEYCGCRYPLQPGTNTVGRACAEHRAQVEIATGEDNTMSRLHALITIGQAAAGYHATIKHHPQATNKTYVNGKELTLYDEFFLSDGQMIQMGQVVVIYRTTRQ